MADFIGAARGIRTPDPLITNEVLYQLSYCGDRASAREAEAGDVYQIAPPCPAKVANRRFPRVARTAVPSRALLA